MAWPEEEASAFAHAWEEEMRALLEGDGAHEVREMLEAPRALELHTRGVRRFPSYTLHVTECTCLGPGARQPVITAFPHSSILGVVAGAAGRVQLAACIEESVAISAWQGRHEEVHGWRPDLVARERVGLTKRRGSLTPWAFGEATNTGDSHPRLAQAREEFTAQLREQLRVISCESLGEVLAGLTPPWEDEEEATMAERAAWREQWIEVLEGATSTPGAACTCTSSALVAVRAYEYDLPEFAVNVLHLWMEEIGAFGWLVLGTVCESAWAGVEGAGAASLAGGVRVRELPEGRLPDARELELAGVLLAESGKHDSAALRDAVVTAHGVLVV